MHAKMRVLSSVIAGLVVVVMSVSSLLAKPVAPNEAPNFVPLGAYLSWERIGSCAKYHIIDRWDDVCLRLDALSANHVDTLWVTNMSEAHLPRLIQECKKRGMKVLPSMSIVDCKMKYRWHNGGKHYDSVVPRVVKLAGGSKTLIGWVLSDEPRLDDLPNVENLHQRFRKADPGRFCTTVTMWPQTPHVPEKTNLPVVCIDLYPFFGPKDPNGPHTDAASQNFLRVNARRMIEAIKTSKKNAVGWVMGQCFSDIWGPKKYDARGHLIALPGSYLHWRCPTLAEMRWQVWETFRSGAKGIIIYTLAPETPNPKTESLPASDAPKKCPGVILIKKPTSSGPNALTNPDATVTPQLEELGKAYKLIAPHKALIRRWEPTGLLIAEVESPGRIQCFIDPLTKTYYAVVVNDDLHRPQSMEVRLALGGEKRLEDIVRHKKIELKKDFLGGSSAGRITLAAGEGTILKILSVPQSPNK